MAVANKYLLELYQKCYDLAKTMLYLPYGIPTPHLEDYPSEHFAAAEISAVSNYGTNRVFINRQWAEKCLKENIAEYEFIILHEFRHFHQYSVIRQYRNTGKIERDTLEEIEKWEFEFSHYIPNRGDDDSRKANAAQLCERDANAYGLILVNLLNIDNSMEINLGLPEGVENDVYRYQQEKPEIRCIMERYYSADSPSLKQATARKAIKIGRNDPCPCGSGLKYKKCTCSQYHEEYR